MRCEFNVLISTRDEARQEQLWEISVNSVRPHLSQEVMERFGEAHTGTAQSATLEGRCGGNEGQSAAAVDQSGQGDTV